MSYWKKQKQRLEEELEELNTYLSEWRMELSIANSPDRRRLCNKEINSLESRIEKYENDLEGIEKKLSKNITKDKVNVKLKEISIKLVKNLIDNKRHSLNKLLSNTGKDFSTPYKYGEVIERVSNDNKGSRYTIEDNKGNLYYCTYADLLTEGFRSLRVGDRVRFVAHKLKHEQLATYVIKIEKDLTFLNYINPNMKKEIKNHYDKLSSIYDQLWTYSDDFVYKISQQIIEQLELKKEDILVDYGCGTGIYSKAISQQVNLRHDIICTDLSEKMLSKLENKKGFNLIVRDAIEFSEMKLEYDKVFIKEMIHHIKEGKQRIYKNIYSNLNPNGIFIILLLPPKIDYPLFDDAIQYYEKHQPHYSEIVEGFKDTGFQTSVEFIEYPLEIEKERYYNMVRHRYMSLLSRYSDSEIEIGIKEMEEKFKHSSILSFKDIFVVVKGKKLC